MNQAQTIESFNAFRKQYKNRLQNLESTLEEFQKKSEPYQEAKYLSRQVEDDAFLNFEITQKVIAEMEKTLGFKLNKTETSTLKYMLAADDFSLMKLLKQGYETIRPYAIPLLKQVARTYGIPSDIIDLLPDKDTRAQKVLVKQGRDLSAANKLAICTLICPEVYRTRFPTVSSVNSRVALGHGRMTIPVTTNNVGAGVINCYTRAPGAANFLSSLSDNSLNLIGGNQAVIGTVYFGPYFNSAIVDQGFNLATSVSFRPTLSAMNANGRVYLSYYQEEVIQTNRNISFVPQGDALQAPFFQEGTILSELRQVTVMNSPEDLSMNEPLSIGSGHVVQLIVQGGPVNQVVGQFVIDYTIQFTCFANYMNLIDLDNPTPGPATLQTLSTLYSEHPKLSQLSYQQAQKVCDCILSTSGSYEEIVDCVTTQ